MTDQHLRDTSKLPKWARDHIELLEIRLAEAKEELTAHLEHPMSSVAVERTEGMMGNGPRFVYLPRGATIAFFLDDDLDIEPRERKIISVRRAQQKGSWSVQGVEAAQFYLEVSTGGSCFPSVQPQAANVVRIRAVDAP